MKKLAQQDTIFLNPWGRGTPFLKGPVPTLRRFPLFQSYSIESNTNVYYRVHFKEFI